MAYKINKTDGSIISELLDGTIDQTSTSITLIGKNVPSYGEFLNENFLHMLENFANSSMPENPVTGQLWFDTSDYRLKVYDGRGFKINNGPIVQPERPINFTQGDLWIDSKENQLYFYDGIDLQLSGPIYAKTQGISGFTVETITDTSSNKRVIVKLWVSNKLLGIFSKDEVTFYPAVSIPGFSGGINPGFNQSNLDGMKFNVTATKAESIVDEFGNTILLDTLMRTDINNFTSGILSIENTVPIRFGENLNTEIRVNSTSFELVNTTLYQDMVFKVKNGTSSNAIVKEAIKINSKDEHIGIFNHDPQHTLDVSGDTRINGNFILSGNLSIDGTLFSTSSSLNIQNNTITLGNITSSTDITANGSGIIIKGDSDKEILWNSLLNSFDISENINISSNKNYYINDELVLSSTQLGDGISIARGITEVGTLIELSVDDIYINSNIIKSNSNLEIDTNLLKFKNITRIEHVATPIYDTDACNKLWTTNYVKSRIIPISLDITGLQNIPTDIITILREIAPQDEYITGTECRVHCVDHATSPPTRITKKFNLDKDIGWEWISDLP